MSLGPTDMHLVNAAHGWLGLGDWVSANGELDDVCPEFCAHPEVLRVRVLIYEAGKQWAVAAEVSRALTKLAPEDPFGWIHWVFALGELKRARAIADALLPFVEKYPGEYQIYHSLSRYACQLGNYTEALQWLQRAIDLANAQAVHEKASNEADLLSLWNEAEKFQSPPDF